jgi:adenosylcobinamide kinase/adenosylcobinamide-phosphate guanylyltransferase
MEYIGIFLFGELMAGKKKTQRGKLTLVLGGARSGKSAFALKRANERISFKGKNKKAFIATLNPLDEEMKGRVLKHKKERDMGWKTFEEELKIPALIRELKKDNDIILVDCLTLWISNLMLNGIDVEKEAASLVRSLKGGRADVILVSNEVGMGIVPESALARSFRDNAGRLNQIVASEADEVYFVASGIPIKIKGD